MIVGFVFLALWIFVWSAVLYGKMDDIEKKIDGVED